MATRSARQCSPQPDIDKSSNFRKLVQFEGSGDELVWVGGGEAIVLLNC